MIHVTKNPGATWSDTETRLMWLFRVLWDEQQRNLCGLSHILDEMEFLVEKDHKSRSLFSSRVASIVADLSLLSECQRQINLYQPWASCFGSEALTYQEDLKNNYIKRTSRLQELNTAIGNTSLADGDPSDGKFFYPIEKRGTKENTEAMQAAERYLDGFWEKLDRYVTQKIDMSHHGALTRLLSDNRILRRTPDWVQPDAALPATGRQNEATLEEEDKPLSRLFSDTERRGQGQAISREKTHQKAKVKTRGVARPSPSAASPSSQAPSASYVIDEQPTFKLDKRSFKVFSTLFHKPSANDQPGEIPWNDFLHAMGATGFAIEKLYGSAWHFSPTKLDVERSIQFHEPHPSNKIPFRTARRFGRRLFRAYGWRGDMFKLESA